MTNESNVSRWVSTKIPGSILGCAAGSVVRSGVRHHGLLTKEFIMDRQAPDRHNTAAWLSTGILALIAVMILVTLLAVGSCIGYVFIYIPYQNEKYKKYLEERDRKQQIEIRKQQEKDTETLFKDDGIQVPDQ